MPNAAQYMQQVMQTLASANAAAIVRGVPVHEVSLHCISYAHRFPASLHHGTISDFDGSIQVTWSFDDETGRKQQSNSFGQDSFTTLWNEIIDLPVFRRNMVSDGNREVNPVAFHVVGFASLESSCPAIGLYMIPAEENDENWICWLDSLQPPKIDGNTISLDISH